MHHNVIGRPSWFTQFDYDAAVSASRCSGKPILIYFHSEGCVGCRSISREVLRNQGVIADITAHTIPIWVDVESERREPITSTLIGSHIFIMSPVVQLISADGDIYHKFRGSPLHTRLDLGYDRVHHDLAGKLTASEFQAQLTIGLGRRALSERAYDVAETILSDLAKKGDLSSEATSEAAYWLKVAASEGIYGEEDEASPNTASRMCLAGLVEEFCGLLIRIPDDELMRDWRGSPGKGSWTHYSDCLREVVFGIYQALLDTGAEIDHSRAAAGEPLNSARRILREWHIAYRSFRGVIFGLSGADWDRQHLHENFSLGKQRTIRNNIVHCVMAEFWAHGTAIRNAMAALDDNPASNEQPIERTCSKYGMPPANFGSRQEILQLSEQRHADLLGEFAGIQDEKLDTGRSWWEDSDVTVRFRLNRLGWHLRDHSAVIETICERIGRKRRETERLAMLLHAALGQAEAAGIGLEPLELQLHFGPVGELLSTRSRELAAIYELQ